MPKRVAIGIVKSDKMSKTRVVEIPRKVRHPKYGKYMRARTVCYVHDEDNTSGEGDTVEIIESKPMSKKKRWSLVKVVEKSRLVDVTKLRAAQKAEAEKAAELAKAAEASSEAEGPATEDGSSAAAE